MLWLATLNWNKIKPHIWKPRYCTETAYLIKHALNHSGEQFSLLLTQWWVEFELIGLALQGLHSMVLQAHYSQASNDKRETRQIR